jgi:hypothetical protein
MEVHHHPELPHGKKKHFKEYVLEFLMIFLAVTMGFIAENIREHISDHSKEKEYITGMIKDLAIDTTNLKTIVNYNKKQKRGFDSLRAIPKEKLADIKVQDSLYLYTHKYLFEFHPFKNDDVTLIQLRNAGGYRLIRNQNVLDSIAGYESRINISAIQLNYLYGSLTKSIDAASIIFDLNEYNKFKSNPLTTPVLITADKEKINAFYNQSWLMSIAVKNYGELLEDQLEYTSHIIKYIKAQYNIE